MAGLSRGETAEIVGHLQTQGARVEGRAFRSTAGKPTTGLRFPLKVYPPNGSPMFTIHQTVGDVRQRKILDSIIRRAGLEPLGGRSRKETEVMSNTARSEDAPMEHVKVPPAVTNRTHPPTEESIKRFTPYLKQMPPTFWTDELAGLLQAHDVQGYRGNAGAQRTIDLLDWCGYRVVEFKPNRGGFSYRWAKDLNAVVKPGVTREERAAKASRALLDFRARQREGKVTPIRANGEPVREVATNVGAALQDALLQQEAKASIAIDEGDHDGHTISLEEPKKLHHDRKQCATCQRWFTPDGFERHVAETEHGLVKPEPDAVPQGNSEKPKLLLEMDENHKLRMVADAESLPGRVDVVPKTDYDALEAMALETERKLAEAHGEAESLRRVHEQYQADIRAREAEVVELRAQVAALGQAAADDGSWLLEEDSLDGDMTLIELMASARRMRVVLELRARRA